MPRIILGVFHALVASIVLSLFASLFICFGLDPESRAVSDAAVPLLGIFAGAWVASPNGSWRIGLGTGLVYVIAWFVFWMYVMGRLNSALWIEEAIPRLTLFHALWWVLAMAAGIGGGWAGRWGFRICALILLLSCAVLIVVMADYGERRGSSYSEVQRGFSIERMASTDDQTVVYLLAFDFFVQPQLKVGLYDCDSDDARPRDDSDTVYMGQSLGDLIRRLSLRAAGRHSQMLCAINGGFFGASGFSVAHHEEPMVEEGVAFYDVDLLRPKEQGWLFAVNSQASVQAGHARFSMMPSLPWKALGDYQTILGGVRPLRVGGSSVLLLPGAGATALKCSRTSVGWSADGSKFYVLVVYDPESEGASQMQRKMGWQHEGGWNVRDVQKFWEQKAVPFALLFDGGESTQLAFRQVDGTYHQVASGYQYSYTLGYFLHRPLLATLPILPPSEAHRGVLNYLYVDGPNSP